MDDAKDYAEKVKQTYGADAKPAARAPVKVVEVESEASRQKRIAEVNEDPLQKELRLKREAKKNAEMAPMTAASASDTNPRTPPPGLGALAAAIAKNRASAQK